MAGAPGQVPYVGRPDRHRSYRLFTGREGGARDGQEARPCRACAMMTTSSEPMAMPSTRNPGGSGRSCLPTRGMQGPQLHLAFGVAPGPSCSTESEPEPELPPMFRNVMSARLI